MTKNEIREMIEDVANLTAIQIVRPIENRLTVLETKICCKENVVKDEVGRKWKIIGFCLAVPGFLGAAAALVKMI